MTQTFTALQGLSGLTNKVAIYVPGTNGANTQAVNSAWVNDALGTLSLEFGGATAQAVTGAWMSDEHGLIKEQTTVVYANASEITDENMSTIVHFASALCEALSQEAVAIEVNGTMYFIEATHVLAIA